MRLLTNFTAAGKLPSVSVLTNGKDYFVWKYGDAPKLPDGPDTQRTWNLRLMKAMPNVLTTLPYAANMGPGLTDAALLGIVADHLEQTNGNADALADVKAAIAKLIS